MKDWNWEIVQLVRKFPTFCSERKKRTTSGGSPQCSNKFSGKLLFHLTFNRNFRIFWPNGKHPCTPVPTLPSKISISLRGEGPMSITKSNSFIRVHSDRYHEPKYIARSQSKNAHINLRYVYTAVPGECQLAPVTSSLLRKRKTNKQTNKKETKLKSVHCPKMLVPYKQCFFYFTMQVTSSTS